MPVHTWKQRLKEPLPFYCPYRKLRFVLKAFDEIFPQEFLYPRKQVQELRQTLFPLAESFQSFDADQRRKEMLSKFTNPLLKAAIQRGESLDTILFADLPSEKCLGRVPKETSIADIILTANTHLIKGIIQRSQRLDIQLRGQLRPIVRQALLRGLICVAKPLQGQTEFDAILSLSGPLGLFRHARVYGRLLSEIIPFLPKCDRFYWTPAYLQKKVENLRRAKIDRLIICVSRKLGCSDEWPKNARLVFFDRWIKPEDVLRVMEIS
jgi:predicted nuclease of restriction endonuclease-like RecB superfamily